MIEKVKRDLILQTDPVTEETYWSMGFAENAIEPLIIEKAREYRQGNPSLGCVKLYMIIRRLFESTGCMPGRDAFIELLRKNGLMVQIKRRRHYKTTDTNHNYHKYDNLIKERVPPASQ